MSNFYVVSWKPIHEIYVNWSDTTSGHSEAEGAKGTCLMLLLVALHLSNITLSHALEYCTQCIISYTTAHVLSHYHLNFLLLVPFLCRQLKCLVIIPLLVINQEIYFFLQICIFKVKWWHLCLSFLLHQICFSHTYDQTIQALIQTVAMLKGKCCVTLWLLCDCILSVTYSIFFVVYNFFHYYCFPYIYFVDDEEFIKTCARPCKNWNLQKYSIWSWPEVSLDLPFLSCSGIAWGARRQPPQMQNFCGCKVIGNVQNLRGGKITTN